MIQNGKAQLFHKWVSMCLIGWSDFLFQQWLAIWRYGVSIDFMVHISEKKKRMKISFFFHFVKFLATINHSSYKKQNNEKVKNRTNAMVSECFCELQRGSLEINLLCPLHKAPWPLTES